MWPSINTLECKRRKKNKIVANFFNNEKWWHVANELSVWLSYENFTYTPAEPALVGSHVQEILSSRVSYTTVRWNWNCAIPTLPHMQTPRIPTPNQNMRTAGQVIFFLLPLLPWYCIFPLYVTDNIPARDQCYTKKFHSCNVSSHGAGKFVSRRGKQCDELIWDIECCVCKIVSG